MRENNESMLLLDDEFKRRTISLIGNDEYTKLEDALNANSSIGIRYNSQKKTKRTPDFGLNEMAKNLECVPWCNQGYYLEQRGFFTLDPLLHAGAYYVQEPSSMFLSQVIEQYTSCKPLVCLDLCGAPGGKSTLLIDKLPKGSLIVSNEVIKSRSKILAENITKWGSPFSIVTNNDPSDFNTLPQFFDIIVVDAPCSGEGMFRKDHDSTKQWSTANVDICAARQRRIVSDVWNALKPGGILVYSTCTYNREENEDNIRIILDKFGATSLPIEICNNWNIMPSIYQDIYAYRFFPHKTKGEGFFISVVKKTTGEEIHTNPSKPKRKTSKYTESVYNKNIIAQAKQWIDQSLPMHYFVKADYAFAIPEAYKDAYQKISENLHLVSAGIRICQAKGKDIIPTHSLAMSQQLKNDAFQAIELDKETALNYLRKSSININEHYEKGYKLMTYKGIPIGFVKHLGNRINNLYPNDWRIKTL